MAHRAVSGLLWARPAAQAPHKTPRAGKGAKGLGLRYERALAKALPLARHGEWFEYCDANGRGYCQPDYLTSFFGSPFVLETKLRDVAGGIAQIEELYQPVLEHCLSRRVHGIVLVRTASALPRGIPCHHNLRAAVEAAWGLRPSVLLWREGYPLVLGPQSTPTTPQAFAPA